MTASAQHEDECRASASAAALIATMLDEYERGAKFEHPTAKDVLKRVDEDAFPAAFAPNGHDLFAALMEDVAELQFVGALRVVRERLRGAGERMELRLGPNEVLLAYAVAAQYGFQPLRAVLNGVRDHAERLRVAALADSRAPLWWRDYLAAVIAGAAAADLRLLGIATRARVKAEWGEVRDALVAADALARRVDAWARHVSESLFADSKRLTTIAPRVAAILRAADPQWAGVDTSPDPGDVLQAYGIRRRPLMITCAGAFTVRRSVPQITSPREYHLSDFDPVGILPGAWGPDLAVAAVDAGVRVVTTIENEYPLLSYVEEAGGPAGLGDRGELVVWSGGFVADHVLDVLTRIAQAGGERVSFRHWGDADPAGLSIWWQIRSNLRRPVDLFRATPAWVEQAASREGRTLSDSERRLLNAHRQRFQTAAEQNLRLGEPGQDLIVAASMADTLLRLGIKLEQERQ